MPAGVPVPLMLAVAVNDAPGASAASPTHNPNGEAEAVGKLDESRHVSSPSEVVKPPMVTPVLWLNIAATNVPLQVFVPLLMVVEMQWPDEQLTVMARLQVRSAYSGAASKTRERRSSGNLGRNNDFLLSIGLVALRQHCPTHTCCR